MFIAVVTFLLILISCVKIYYDAIIMDSFLNLLFFQQFHTVLLVLNSQFVSPYHFRPNSGEGKPYLAVDQDQQYKITVKIEGKADLTAKGW